MDKIVVLDFGSQYSHLICRRLREINIYCEILPYDTPVSVLKKLNPKGIIFSGGPESIYSKGSPRPDRKIFDVGIPILGICYGHQLIIDHFGGKIKRTDRREYGRADLIIDDKYDLFNNMNNKIKCWMSHGDAAEMLPQELKILAHTQNSFSAAIGNQEKAFYGLQFHPEVVHTESGIEILRNFSQIISKAQPEWNIESFIEMSITNIRNVIGKEERVLCAVSGGIDSTTVAALLNRAIGNNVQCVFVNHGLLRQNEEETVIKLFKEFLGIEVVYVNAEKQFIEKLNGIHDPEKKRLIIGEEFANVFV
ncbi:MAG TPA: glutamine-hydrolyzing GMP synthase, partial [Nitrososphaeraceae archaeon]